MTPAAIADEIRAARDDFHRLVGEATTAELRMRSDGTKWTNDQLLFHMLFGYLIVRTLLGLVRGFSMLPPGASRRFAQGLNAATRPFHVINYLGSLGGARVLGHAGMERVTDQVTTGLIRTLEHASDKQLARGMHFPEGWDPYFRDFMTVQDVLHYATLHYQHHRSQLTLSNAQAE
ncbi:MAG: DinB family protein [Mycobacteriaceae bacterium]